MKTNLVKQGDKFFFVIEPEILELLNIDENTLLEISRDGERIFIKPVRKVKNQRVTFVLALAIRKKQNYRPVDSLVAMCKIYMPINSVNIIW